MKLNLNFLGGSGGGGGGSAKQKSFREGVRIFSAAAHYSNL